MMKYTKMKGALGQSQRVVLALALALGGLVLAGAAHGQGISGTPHDLTSGSGQIDGSPLGGSPGEICAYCHTPHGGDTAAQAPLWNRSLPSGATFTRYSTLGTSTLRGEETANVGSVSLACLSCHDGTQALDSVINQPGRGNGNTAATMASLDGTVNGPITLDNENAVIGNDLQDDHPIGIQYCGGGISAGNLICEDSAGFNAPLETTINDVTVWWVDTGGNTTRERSDMFLYTRDFATGGTGPSVECGSCHDPHVNSARGTDASEEVNFMRISNSGSAVCLACHNK